MGNSWCPRCANFDENVKYGIPHILTENDSAILADFTASNGKYTILYC